MLKLSIIGNLGADPQFKETENQKMIKLSVGVGVRRKKETVTQWLDVILFGNQFDRILPLLVKGVKLYVFGNFDINVDANTGKTYWNLIADAIQVLSQKKPENTEPTGKYFSHAFKPQEPKQTNAFADDEIPF